MSDPVGGREADPYTVCRQALNEAWIGQASPSEVVGWMFVALDAADDRTVPRDEAARNRCVTMAAMVFADIGSEEHGTDMGAVVSNVLRAAHG